MSNSSIAPIPSEVERPVFSDNTRTRVTALALVLGAIGLFFISLQQPWWFFRLYAPQYPRGLTLVISLAGLSGDVREIDMLNHYIGMGHLDAAARFEREYAAYGIAGLSATLLGIALFARRSWVRWLGPIGALFPLGFVADSFYWLHRFGHELDPRAPLHLPTFTPQLFGNGTIGQFMTFARPERGFWLAVFGVALLFGASFVRPRAEAP